jgi:transposase
MICYKETGSAQEVCRKFGISRKTFYKWLKRYKASGGDSKSLLDQSRRPHTFPRATPESSVLLLKRLKEQTGFGQRRLRAYLQEKHNITISERTIWKILKRLEEDEKDVMPGKNVNQPSNIIYTHRLGQ